MKRSLHRLTWALLAVAFLATAALLEQAWGQAPPVVGRKTAKPAAPTPDPTTADAPSDGFENSGLSLPKDETRLGERIKAAKDYIQEKQWNIAIPQLQLLIEHKQDLTVKEPDSNSYVSFKTQAQRLLLHLPKEGMDFYKLSYSGQADALLKKAKETGNMDLLGEIIRRYPVTDACTEAILYSARHSFDRGNLIEASLRYKQLLDREPLDKQPVERLLEIALASPPGQKDGKKYWEALRSRAKEVTLGKLTHSVEEWEAYANSLNGGLIADASDSPMFRGTSARTNLLIGGPAFLDPAWKSTLVHRDKGGFVRNKLQTAERMLKTSGRPVLSSFFPVTATVTKKDGTTLALIVCRGHRGVMAVDLLRDGKVVWECPSSGSLETMLNPDLPEKVRKSHIDNWLKFYLEDSKEPEVLFENSINGTLSTDNTYVYAIDDFQVPVYQPVFDPRWGGVPPPMPATPDDIPTPRHKNKLLALNLARDGAVGWEVGEEKGELAESYFLGPPLPLGGKLYVLNEKQQDLRLVCLDPAEKGKVVSIQVLATAKDEEKVENNRARRMTAVHLAYSDGILVVPTHLGAVFGFDLLENRLVWARPYRKGNERPVAAAPPPGGLPPGAIVLGPGGAPMRPATTPRLGGWKEAAPAIQDGKVVFTSPDSRHLHCINLLDGTDVWDPIPRAEDDLYFAGVYRGKVLIVGKKYVRALDLATGNPAWPQPLEIGLPSGQGIASEGTYYLPIAKANVSITPPPAGIAAIDIDKGTFALARSRPKPDPSEAEVPGNLLFHQGTVISQSPYDLAAYPQLKVKIAEMDARLAKSPDDPAGLLDRGELRLDQGDRLGAIQDLRRALRNKPAVDVEVHIKAKLYDALTEYVQSNFNAAEEYLKEYEDLCELNSKDPKDDKEKARKRRGHFLYLVAKGREKQGRLVDAFHMYKAFAALGADQPLIQLLDEPSVKANADVWARGRISAMLASATPEERKPLEKLIADNWEQVKTGNLDEVRQFLKVFGSVSAVGKEARFLLAEKLVEEGKPESLLEAERELQMLRLPREAPETAARAVEALARLYTRRGLLEDAAYCYRLLGRKYNAIKVRDGKTGGDFFDEAATDKFLRPYMDEVRIAPVGTIKGKEEMGGSPLFQQVYHYAQAGESLPYFRRYSVALNFTNHNLELLDNRALNPDNRKRDLKLAQTYMQTFVLAKPNAARIRYRTIGHMLIVPNGQFVHGIDPVQMRLVWERNLAGTGTGKDPQSGNIVIDRDGTPVIPYLDWKQRLGQFAAVGNSVVCLHMHDESGAVCLEALDPLTGNTLWRRSDVASSAEIFADDENIYVVDLNDEGRATSGRTFRAVDGVTALGVPNFAAQYQKRSQVVGHNILLSETAASGAMTLKIYDILQGKDVWSQDYPAKSVLLQPQETTLGGVVQPDGMVHVIDVATQQEVLKTEKGYIGEGKSGIEPASLRNLQNISLLQDSLNIYIACNGVLDPDVTRWGPLIPNLHPGLGLRAVPVNGKVYVYDRQTGNFSFYVVAPNQMLVMERFEDLPVLLFTSTYAKAAAGVGRAQLGTFIACDKRTGLHLVDDVPRMESLPDGSKHEVTWNNPQQFHTLQVDEREQRVEFISPNRKYTFALTGGETKVGTTDAPSP
jgi:outer membrane protein assembly factor BamB